MHYLAGRQQWSSCPAESVSESVGKQANARMFSSKLVGGQSEERERKKREQEMFVCAVEKCKCLIHFYFLLVEFDNYLLADAYLSARFRSVWAELQLQVPSECPADISASRRSSRSLLVSNRIKSNRIARTNE